MHNIEFYVLFAICVFLFFTKTLIYTRTIWVQPLMPRVCQIGGKSKILDS
jgi:hypothetical protein